MNEVTLLQKGFVKKPDGTWHKPRAVVRPVAARQPQPATPLALDQSASQLQKGQRSAGYVITLITCRRRQTDDDNNVASLKPLRDAISEKLGVDDGDKRLRWEYGQCLTRHQQGVLVKIQQI